MEKIVGKEDGTSRETSAFDPSAFDPRRHMAVAAHWCLGGKMETPAAAFIREVGMAICPYSALQISLKFVAEEVTIEVYDNDTDVIVSAKTVPYLTFLDLLGAPPNKLVFAILDDLVLILPLTVLALIAE